MAMRRAITDLLVLSGRRPANANLSSLRNSSKRSNPGNVRHNSTKPGSNESSVNEATGSSNKAASAATAVGTAGAATTTTNTTAASTAKNSGRGVLHLIQSGPIGRLGQWYTEVQFKRPYTTQVASAFVIYLAGDLSAQLLFPVETKSTDGEEKPTKAGYDPVRTLRHVTVGVLSSIPTYKWFMFLHHNFNYSSKLLSIATKTAVQQAVFTPVFSTYFFSMSSLLAGASIDETIERLKKALLPSILNSFKLWPAVTAFNFMYVPPHFRGVFSGTVAVGWQTYLSWLNQTAAREVAAAEAAAARISVADGDAGLVRISQVA